MPHLETSDITREFSRVTGPAALRGVSLTVAAGEFLAIAGPSGGGKSTLLNVLGLLDVPTSGEYSIAGSSTADLTPDQVTRLRSDSFAFIFQSFHLLDYRPAVESVELGLLYRGVPARVREERARAALAQVGLTHLAYKRANTLSGGERQRVAIARAFATGAPVVLADEPTGNLDSENGRAVIESLAELHKQGTTIVLVTHEDAVARYATRRIRIVDGVLESPQEAVVTPSPSRDQPSTCVVPGRASRLRLRDLLVDAIRSVRSRRGRTAALTAAVAMGVGLAVATTGVSLTSRAQVSDTFDARLNRDVTVAWYSDDLSVKTESSLVADLADVSGVDAVGILDDLGGHAVRAGTARETYAARAFAIYGDLPRAARTDITWATNHAAHLEHGEALVGYQLAGSLSLGPLDARPIVSLDGRNVVVVGIVTSSPREPGIVGAIVVPGEDAALVGEVENRKAVILTLAGAAQQVARQAPPVVNPYTPELLEVNAPTDPADLRNEIEASVRTTLIVVTAVALLAAIASLTNSMVLSVGERTHEIGLRRALGARPVHVSLLICTESSIIGVLGGLLGLVAGLSGILVTTIANQWIPVFDLRLAPIAIAGGIAVGALGGLLAALRASRIQPHEALRL
jgi:macrolide transport system ATP-binding/permease protein